MPSDNPSEDEPVKKLINEGARIRKSATEAPAGPRRTTVELGTPTCRRSPAALIGVRTRKLSEPDAPPKDVCPVAVKVVNVPVDGVMPPIAGGLDRSNVPPKVRLPLVVTVPVKVKPLTVPVPPTEVTVPVPVPSPAAQDRAVPSVFRYLLAFPVCVGNTVPAPPEVTSLILSCNSGATTSPTLIS